MYAEFNSVNCVFVKHNIMNILPFYYVFFKINFKLLHNVPGSDSTIQLFSSCGSLFFSHQGLL